MQGISLFLSLSLGQYMFFDNATSLNDCIRIQPRDPELRERENLSEELSLRKLTSIVNKLTPREGERTRSKSNKPRENRHPEVRLNLKRHQILPL